MRRRPAIWSGPGKTSDPARCAHRIECPNRCCGRGPSGPAGTPERVAMNGGCVSRRSTVGSAIDLRRRVRGGVDGHDASGPVGQGDPGDGRRQRVHAAVVAGSMPVPAGAHRRGSVEVKRLRQESSEVKRTNASLKAASFRNEGSQGNRHFVPKPLELSALIDVQRLIRGCSGQFDCRTHRTTNCAPTPTSAGPGQRPTHLRLHPHRLRPGPPG